MKKDYPKSKELLAKLETHNHSLKKTQTKTRLLAERYEIRMYKLLVIIGVISSLNAVAASDYPLWTFPVLSSKHISDECSLKTNQVKAKLIFADDGEIKEFTFLIKSSIEEINKEAKNNIFASSPYTEYREMTENEKRKHRVVIMQYTIPCKSHNKRLQSTAQKTRLN